MIATASPARPGRRRALRAGTAAGRSGWPTRPGCRPLTRAVFAAITSPSPWLGMAWSLASPRRPRHRLSPFHIVPLPFQAANPSPIQARSEWAALHWQHNHHRHRHRKGSVMNSVGRHRAARLRYLAAAVIGCAGVVTATAATAAAAAPGSHPVPRATAGRTAADATSVQTIHLVAREKQRKFFNNGGFGDEEIFRGILDNAAGTTQVGIFAGTLTSVSHTDSLNLATVDLQLPGGQITVQGFLSGTQSPIVHAVTGRTGALHRRRGEFSFTEAFPGVLDMTLTLLGADQQ